MEKKGDLINQLAIITDLLEKANGEFESTTIIFSLTENEFYRIFELTQKKQNKIEQRPKDTFIINIGKVDILFNKNSV